MNGFMGMQSMTGRWVTGNESKCSNRSLCNHLENKHGYYDTSMGRQGQPGGLER